MAKDINIVITLDGAGNLKKVSDGARKASKETDKLDKSTKKYNKSQEEQYTRQKQGVIQTANTTKNFSKLQQATDGGGAGGLVRAYALLAANVFALTAAFGVLSRASQVDTLIESMEILSTTGGTFIKNLSKELQAASGFAVDLAQSFRQVSLASSAGLSTKEIEGLTTVAKGAAISLGRNLPDAMDRIFRGAIKLEPEILDEIGLFVRVDEAAQKFARNNGKVVSALTQVEKRQAFLNEILEQGTRKFSEYAEEIKPDPYVRLGAALGDIAQNGLTLVNSALGPLLEFLAESKVLLQLVFGALVFVLLKKAVPALGLMTKGTAELATERAAAAKEYSESIKKTMNEELNAEEKKLKARRKTLKESAQEEKRFVSRAKGTTGATTAALDKAKLGTTKRREEVEKRILVLEKASKKAKGENLTIIDAELSKLREELDIERQIKNVQDQQKKGIKPGSLADRRQQKLDSQARVATVVGDSVGTMETQGIREGFSKLNKTLKEGEKQADGTFKAFSTGEKIIARGKTTVAAAGVAFNKLNMMMSTAMTVFAILSPLIIFLGKKMGFARDETKQFNEAMKQSEERSEKLIQRVQKQMEVFDDMETSYFQQNKAALAFNKTMLETIDTVGKLDKAFRAMDETSTMWTRFVDNVIFGFIAIGKEVRFDGQTFFSGSEFEFAEQQFNNFFQATEQAARGSNESIKSIFRNIEGADKFIAAIERQVFMERVLKDAKEASNKALEEGTITQKELSLATGIANNLASDNIENVMVAQHQYKKLPPILQKQVDAQKNLLIQQEHAKVAQGNLSRESKDYRVALELANPILERQTEILKNLDSAMTGASESIGKFQSKFLPKTQVDDVLSSFLQMESGFKKILADPDIDDQKVDDFFKKFADADNAFAGLFAGLFTVDKEGKKVLKDAEKARELFFETIDQFKEYQTEILESKVAIKALQTEQKRYSKLTTAGLQANTKHQQTVTKIAERQLKVQMTLTDVSLKAFGLDRETNKLMRQELNMATTLGEKQRILLKYSQDENKIRAANSFLQEEEEKRIEFRIQLATEELRIAQEFTKEQQRVLKITEEIETGQAKLAISEAKLIQLRKTGTSSLSAREEARLDIEAAKTKLKMFVLEAEMKRDLLQIETDLLKMRIMVLDIEGKINSDRAFQMRKTLDETMKLQGKNIDTQIANAQAEFGLSLSETITKGFSDSMLNGIRAGLLAAQPALEKFDKERADRRAAILIQMTRDALAGKPGSLQDPGDHPAAADAQLARERQQIGFDAVGMQIMRETAEGLANTLSKLGPEGELVASVVQGSIVMADSFYELGQVFSATDNAMERGAAVADTVAHSLMAIGDIMAANSKAQIAEVDQQIAAEKRRDGKSAESLARIKALEKKKEAMAKKAFEQNKKMQMATTIANTAASIMQVWANPADITKAWAISMTALIGGLGAAQLAIISKQKYQGGSSGDESTPMQALNIGRRNNAVDVTRSASMGELSYLRGQRTAAAGMRNYFAGGEGILVGEQGPEVISPSGRVDITPNDDIGRMSNVNFTINAVDATGVEQLLVEQRGNIIGMLREAANETGEQFLEDVDVQAMGGSGGGYG